METDTTSIITLIERAVFCSAAVLLIFCYFVLGYFSLVKITDS